MPKPIQSRHGLTRCTACRAHIRAADRPSATVCPFCGANLRTGRPLISLPSGRGGILAASLLAFSAAGCGGTDADTSNEPAITAEPTGEDPAGGTAPSANQNQPEDDPGYDDSVPDPVAVEAYGAPPPEDDPSQDQPVEDDPQADDDSFRPRPSDEHRPAPRYGLAPGRRPGADRPDPFGGGDR